MRLVDIGVSIFLSAKESNMKLSEYEIVVKSLRKNQRKVITALVLPKIGTDMRKKQNSCIDWLLRNKGFRKTCS